MSGYVDAATLGRILVTALGFATLAVAAFTVAVIGADRASDATRATGVRAVSWLVATTGVSICLAVVTAGILVMTDK